MSRPEYLNYRITEQRRTRLDALASLTHSTSDADTIDAALTIALKETNMDTWKTTFGHNVSAAEIVNAIGNDPAAIVRFLDEQWDEMYGDDPTAGDKPDADELALFARQIVNDAE